MKKRTLFRMTFFQSSSNGIVCQCRFHFSISYIICYIVCYSIYFSIELKLGSCVNATSIWPLPLLHLISRYLHCRSSAHQRQIVWKYWRRRVLFKILQKNWKLKKVKKVKVKNWGCHFCISSLDISAAAHQRQIVWQYWRMREFRFQK